MHLRRNFQAQAVQPDEAGGIVLVVGLVGSASIVAMCGL